MEVMSYNKKYRPSFILNKFVWDGMKKKIVRTKKLLVWITNWLIIQKNSFQLFTGHLNSENYLKLTKTVSKHRIIFHPRLNSLSFFGLLIITQNWKQR